MCIARWITVQGAFAYITSRIEWMTSSPPVPRIAAPRIAPFSASTTIFMNPWVSPFSTARADARHRPLADERASPALANLRLRHAGAAERRIDVERVGGDPIAHPARIVLEQVRDDDLAVVVRSVRERALAVAVAERPDPRDARAELVVDHDVAALVDGDARLSRPRSSVLGRRPTREQHVRAAALADAPSVQSTLATISSPRLAKLMHFAFRRTCDALALDDLPDRGRHVFVLAADRAAAPSR